MVIIKPSWDNGLLPPGSKPLPEPMLTHSNASELTPILVWSKPTDTTSPTPNKVWTKSTVLQGRISPNKWQAISWTIMAKCVIWPDDSKTPRTFIYFHWKTNVSLCIYSKCVHLDGWGVRVTSIDIAIILLLYCTILFLIAILLVCVYPHTMPHVLTHTADEQTMIF